MYRILQTNVNATSGAGIAYPSEADKFVHGI
jgi:hypothetical protein